MRAEKALARVTLSDGFRISPPSMAAHLACMRPPGQNSVLAWPQIHCFGAKRSLGGSLITWCSAAEDEGGSSSFLALTERFSYMRAG